MFHPHGPTFWELARQCLSSTERGYDLLAPKFDVTPFRTPDEILKRVAACLGGPGSIDSALDMCCGTGAAMRVLRPLCRERVTGLDMSQGMLDVARERLADAPGEARIELVRGNALDMPFENEFDLAVCFGALGHILPRDEPQFVSEIHKALRPGGRFAFVTGYMPSMLSRTYWLARGFNGAMRVRNLLVRPPFIMYYLTFLLPGAQRLLEEQGFDVEVREPFEGKFSVLKLVIGTKRP
jgi:ubiquinone/menaquinone biosynthesis C-methylase UbiE